MLSFHLGLDNRALEDSRVAYWLAKGTVLPCDKEKFAKMRDEATLCFSLLVWQAYEVHFSLLSHFESSVLHVIRPS